MIGYIIFATVIAYYLLPVALRRLRPTTVSMYSNLQPLVTAALAIAVGQDVFTWNKPVALILVIFGVFLVTTRRARRETGDVRRETFGPAPSLCGAGKICRTKVLLGLCEQIRISRQ